MTTPKKYPPHISDKYAVSYTTYVNHKCRCRGCSDDHRRKHKEWRDANTPAQRAKRNRMKTERVKRQTEIERKTMPNTGKPWTEEDRKVALNRGLTVRQAANILGRTQTSVKQYRSENRGR